MLLLLAPALLAQTPGLPKPQPLRATTRLVQLSVIAETKDGSPVTDLTRDDFTILDGGRPERVAFFSVESQASHAPIRPLPPGFFTNRLEQLAGSAASATVILFDGLNTKLTDQAYARLQIVNFLRQLRPEDRVALYVMGRGPRVLQDFTADSTVLLKALENYKPEVQPSLEAPMYDPEIPGAAQFGSWLGELTFNLYDTFAPDRAFRTVRALIAIAGHLERLPGRKNLLWVSGDFPFWIGQGSVPPPKRPAGGRKTDWPEIERAARALNRAGLAIYPVDARGLMAPPSTSADLAMFSIMRTLAERTGGRAFYNNNDLRAAFRRAADDARLTYAIGYYPSHNSWKGKFREIKVETGRPGVQLLYRRGYFAQPEEPAEPWYREGILEAAMWSPVEATRLGLTVRARPSTGRSLDFDLQIDARDITLQPQGDAWVGGLDVWLVELDRKELHLRTTGRTNNLHLNEATYRQVMQAKGLLLVEHFEPLPAARLLRLLVRDIPSGALGSVTIRL